MSYLDELRKAAEKQKAEELLQQKKAQEQEDTFRVKVRPALRYIHRYFMELVKHLNYVKPVVSMNYIAENFGEMYDLKQTNYRISGYTERGNECTFLFDSLGEHKFRTLKYRESDMKSLKKELWKHGIQFTCSEQLDDNYKFEKASFVIKPLVSVKFYFSANFETATIDLKVRNFDELGEKIYTISPKEVNRKFLDEFAKYILKQPNTLKLKRKYELSVEQKTALRKETIKRDIEEFDEWLKNVDSQINKQQAPKESPVKLGFFNRFFGRK